MYFLNLAQTLNTAQSKDANLMDRDLMQVVFSLAKAGHQQYVPEIVECMRHERGYVPGTAMLTCHVDHLSDFLVILHLLICCGAIVRMMQNSRFI